jgi:hypothetical protein
VKAKAKDNSEMDPKTGGKRAIQPDSSNQTPNVDFLDSRRAVIDADGERGRRRKKSSSRDPLS